MLLDAERLREAGMTWEDVLSLAGSRVSKKNLWTALLPSLGYMACLRNLRNLDEAGISDADAARLAERIADPEQVRQSRQLPFRFLSAYASAPSLRWGHALEKALDASLANIGELPGRTLVLIDTSASMRSRMSGRSTMTMVQAALFGIALAVKNPAGAEVWGFADSQFRVDVTQRSRSALRRRGRWALASRGRGVLMPRGGSVLKQTEAFCAQVGRVGHGTRIAEAVRSTYCGHDRVVILTDMQTFPDGWVRWNNRLGAGDVSAAVPPHIPVYGFNLVGYARGAMPAGHGNRHEMGGLTDRSFALIGLTERGAKADWPWLDQPAA